jgi:hypothetical protein
MKAELAELIVGNANPANSTHNAHTAARTQ